MSEERSITTVEFETELNPQSKTFLNIAAERILTIENNVVSYAISGAIEIGELLIEAKKVAGHGYWAEWCSENLNYSQRKVERLIKIAKEYGDENSPYLKSTNVSNLSISKALSLLKVPEDEVEAFTEKHDVESMSFKNLEEEIKKLKAEKDGAILETEKLKAEKARLESDLKDAESETEAIKAQLEKKIEAPEPVDSTALESQIKALEESIAKAKQKEEKLKKQIASNEDNIKRFAEEERKKAIADAEANFKKETKNLELENEALKNEKAILEKKLQNASAEGKLKFKILVDQIQESFASCINVADEEDAETGEKMKRALSQVLASMQERL